MATTADFRNGMVLEIDHTLWTITYFQHVKPGKGGAFVRTKLKNVLTGAVVDRTYRAGERVTSVRLERRPVSYSYTDGELFHFMDQETYDLIPISGDMLGKSQLKYLKENMDCHGLVHDGNVISVEIPGLCRTPPLPTPIRGTRAIPHRAPPSPPPWRPVRWSRCPSSSRWAMFSGSTGVKTSTSPG